MSASEHISRVPHSLFFSRITVLVKHGPLTRDKKADVGHFSSAILLLHILSWGPYLTRTVIHETKAIRIPSLLLGSGSSVSPSGGLSRRVARCSYRV